MRFCGEKSQIILQGVEMEIVQNVSQYELISKRVLTLPNLTRRKLRWRSLSIRFRSEKCPSMSVLIPRINPT